MPLVVQPMSCMPPAAPVKSLAVITYGQLPGSSGIDVDSIDLKYRVKVELLLVEGARSGPGVAQDAQQRLLLMLCRAKARIEEINHSVFATACIN